MQTEDIGRLVLYADVLTSSQHILSKKLTHGLVVIPRQQTDGTGRSKNRWLSPIGCAAFSLQMHIPLDSNMGMHLSMIQHLVMIAVVSAVKKMNGCEVRYFYFLGHSSYEKTNFAKSRYNFAIIQCF